MKTKTERPFYLLLQLFIVMAIIGGGMLLYANLGSDDIPAIGFSLIAFTVSVAALVMTTLQSISIARQVRVTQRSARLVHESSLKLEALVDENRRLERTIRKDIKLDHEIITILEEYGIGKNEAERRNVATRITKSVTR